MEWQPIETAPKDGRLILAAHDETYQGGVVVISWRHEYNAWADYDCDFWKPSHWMPLPEPPK
jgi:hypothetical protein